MIDYLLQYQSLIWPQNKIEAEFQKSLKSFNHQFSPSNGLIASHGALYLLQNISFHLNRLKISF